MKQKRAFIFLFATPSMTAHAAQPFALACEIHRRGHAVLVATDGKRKGDFAAHVDDAGLPRLSGLVLSTKSGPHEALADAVKLKEIIAGERPDALVSSHTHDHVLSAIAKSTAKTPRVVRFVNSPEPRLDPLSKLVLGRTDAFLFFSRLYRDNFARTLKEYAGRFHYLSGPADTGAFCPGPGGLPFREAFGLTERHLVFGMALPPHGRESVEAVLKAFAIVVRKHGAARLMLTGRAEAQKEIEAVVAEHGIRERVVVTGFRTTDLTDAYRAMDVFVQLEEGHDSSCRTVLEAMATGVPVVVAARGALAEIANDGTEGRVVPGNASAADLAKVLGEIASDPPLRKQMGDAARHEAVASHSLPEVTDLFLATVAP
jgi:glycosyltransferase involved in cell wall biosynthesis